MTEERRREILALEERYEDLPDGAFFAALEEHDIYPEDLKAAEEEPEE